MKYKLSDICTFTDERIAVTDLDLDNYISTENMLQNKEGVIRSAGLPTVNQIQAYQPGDVLISNIRPYFKKIWYADRSGGCSNDVLVLRPKENTYPGFLYYLLSDNAFFNYATATAKGTKMPRGDKDAIMKYEVPNLPIGIQIKIADILSALDAQISNNKAINNHLEQIARAIFKSWFVDFEPFGGKMPKDWREYRLKDFLSVITGKKNADISSNKGKYPFFSCSQDIRWTDEYSFDANAILVAGNGDFNIKWYKGKFEAYQRTYVLIPTISRYTSWLYYTVKFNLATIVQAARGSVINFITKGNLENFQFVAPNSLDSFAVIDQFMLINNMIDNNISEINNLAVLRDILLPKLMSGEIDVSHLKTD